MKILSQGSIKEFSIKAALAVFVIASISSTAYLTANEIFKPKINDFLTQSYKSQHFEKIEEECYQNENENYLLSCDDLKSKGILDNIYGKRTIITLNGERSDLEGFLSDSDLDFEVFNNTVNTIMKNDGWFEPLQSFNQEIKKTDGSDYHWINVQIEQAQQFINHNIGLNINDAINIILYHEIAHTIDDKYLYSMDNEDNKKVQTQKKESFSDLYSIINTLKDHPNLNSDKLIEHFIEQRKVQLEKDNYSQHFTVPALASLKQIIKKDKNFIKNFNNSESDLVLLSNITNHSINIASNYGKETEKQKEFLNSYLENGLSSFQLNVINATFNEYQLNKNYEQKNPKQKKLKVS